MQQQSPLIGILTKLTRFLMIFAFGLVLLIVSRLFIVPEPKAVSLISNESKEADETVPESGAAEAAADYEPYRVLFESRDIFAVPYEKEVIVPAPKVPDPEPTLLPTVELDQIFNLVGIVVDQEKPQAIIEDLESGGTVFLTVGDKIGEAILKRVLADRVIFQFQGSEVELLP